MRIKQAIDIAKGCVMASFMDSETKQTVIEALSQVAISKTETNTPITLADKVKKMAHCAIDAGIIDAVDWSAEIIRRLEGTT